MYLLLKYMVRIIALPDFHDLFWKCYSSFELHTLTDKACACFCFEM